METIKEIMKRAQIGTKLQTLSVQILPKITRSEDGQTSISLYTGTLSLKGITESLAKVKAAFPELENGFYAILTERLKEKGFSDERLKDAVVNVIENCIYPKPTIAQFISYDKKRRLFTYQEMVEKVHFGGAIVWNYYDKQEIQGVVYWYLKAGG